MNRPARFMIVVPLLSMFMAMSLSALAEEPRRGEPAGGDAPCAPPLRPAPF